MLNPLYRSPLSRYLTDEQLITLEILVYLIQTYKQVKIERLAAYFPLPIKYESRRRRIQRLLKLPALSVSLLWLPIIQKIINRKFSPQKTLYLVLDRTRVERQKSFYGWGSDVEKSNARLLAVFRKKRSE